MTSFTYWGPRNTYSVVEKDFKTFPKMRTSRSIFGVEVINSNGDSIVTYEPCGSYVDIEAMLRSIVDKWELANMQVTKICLTEYSMRELDIKLRTLDLRSSIVKQLVSR